MAVLRLLEYLCIRPAGASSGNATPGSKDNPILLDDDEESPRPSSLQPTPTATSINGSSVDDSDESSQVTAHSSGGPARQKRKRSLDGMQAWGSAEFHESETEKLQSAWLNVQIRWCAIEAFVSELKGHSSHLERLVTNFNAYWFDFCVKVKHSGSIDLSSVPELIDHWKKVEQELKKVKGSGKRKHKVLEFGQTLDWLEDKMVLYDCIEEYSNSADRKDEDKDGDFEDEEIRPPSKTRRR
ncbi:hypothetical protein MMC13_004875 [Lambiella insularis]|nr:hypothetical protein [Lambiella insularis]